jgi:hypothetical protein
MTSPLSKPELLKWPTGWTRQSSDTVSIPLPSRVPSPLGEKEKKENSTAVPKGARMGSETKGRTRKRG